MWGWLSFFIGDCMSESRYALKSALVFLWLAVVIGLLCMFTRPVHAYETTKFDPTVISYDTGTPYSFSIFHDTNSLGSFGTSRKGIGFEFSNPIPYYSDGDHYSIFLHYVYLMPAYVMQYGYSECYIYPFTNSPNMSFVETGTQLFMVGQPTSYNNSYKGQKTFRTYGDASCSVKYQYFTAYIDTATIAVSVNMVLDLNLVPEMELFPFRLGMQMSYSGSTTYDHQIMNNYGFYYTDTSLYGVLEGIEEAVENLKISVDVSSLETQISAIYDLNSAFYDELLAELENPTFSDPELTQAENAAASLSDIIADVGSVEEAVLGTLNPDWNQFPTGVDMQNIGTYFLPFFSNPIIFALVSACLALMIVFAII